MRDGSIAKLARRGLARVYDSRGERPGQTAIMKRGTAPDRQGEARREAAETLAIAALGYLAAEPKHLGGFLAATGIGPDQIRNAARDREFLSGVLDYFSGDEALLVAFAREQDVDPAEIERARTALGGVWERDVP